MVGTVNQSSFQSNNWISCQNTVFYTVLKTFFNCWEEGFRNSTAEYLFLEYKAVANGWFKFDPYITELTMTTGLFLVFALYFYYLADGFTVSNSWNFKRNRYAEFIFQFGNQNIQMLLTYTRYQLLLDFCVVLISDVWIFFHLSL